jgi:hypothetical protein
MFTPWLEHYFNEQNAYLDLCSENNEAEPLKTGLSEALDCRF